MFGLGHYEMIAIFVVVLLLFGNRFPAVARSIAKSIVGFRRGLREVDVRKDIERTMEQEDKG